MCRRSDAMLKSYMRSSEHKRNLINFIELNPNIIIEDVKTINLRAWSEAESSDTNNQLSSNLDQWSEVENSDTKIKLPPNVGEWSEADNSHSAISLNLDESSEAIYWGPNTNSDQCVEVGNLDSLPDTQSLDQTNQEINTDESDEPQINGEIKRRIDSGQCVKTNNLDSLEDTQSFDDTNTNESNEQQIKEEIKSRSKYGENTSKPKKALQVCNICGKQVYRIHEHLLTHNDVHIECSICNKRFQSEKGLRDHQMLHAGEKPYKCKLCPVEYATKYRLTEHESNKHDIQPPTFNCDNCNTTFATDALLAKHLQSYVHMYLNHSKNYRNVELDGYVKCKICDKEFKCLKYLKQHDKLKHQPDGKKHICEMCGKAFLFKACLRDHIATHTGERFNCDICNDSFINYRTLRKHIKANHESVE